MRSLDAGVVMLEPQTVAHAGEMFAVLSDPAIYEFENEPPSSLEWLRARYAKLESRQSQDGLKLWLNWVIRLPSGQLVGYVQATVIHGSEAFIAYELGSAHWGRGLASAAVRAMMTELVSHYQVGQLWAVLKRANHRSVRLLERLGFSPSTPAQHVSHHAEIDEVLYTLVIDSEGRLAAASH